MFLALYITLKLSELVKLVVNVLHHLSQDFF